MIRNQTIYKKIGDLAIGCWQAYEQFMKKGGWRHIIYGKNPDYLLIEVFGWGRGKESLEQRAKGTPNLKVFYPCIDAFESCLNSIIKDKALDRINDFSSKLATNPNFVEIVRMILVDFLSRLVEKTQEGPEWATQTFGIDLWSLYEELESFLYAKKQFFKFVSPIANFRYEEPLSIIEIEDNLKIIDAWGIRREMERVPEVFKKRLPTQQGIPPMHALEVAFETEKWGNLGTVGNRLVLTNSSVYAFNINADFVSGAGIAVGNVGGLPIQLIRSLYNSLTALRLLKSGDIGLTAVYVVSPRPFSRWMPINLPSFMLPRQQLAKQYTLAKNESKQIKELLRFLSQMHVRTNPLRKMDLAVNRFNYSYQRENIEDRLIDYVIVLEALLLREKLELKYRLSLRSSMLLCKGDEEKSEEIFHFIRQAYDLRSDVVHGANITKTLRKMGMSLEEVVSKLEEYARGSIREMFVRYQQYRNKERVLESLEEMILKPSTRKSSESYKKEKEKAKD